MTPLEPEIPEAGEQIHLPGPSTQPMLVALGTMILLIGVTFNFVLVILGTVLVVWQCARWIADTRAEIAELPADHH